MICSNNLDLENLLEDKLTVLLTAIVWYLIDGSAPLSLLIVHHVLGCGAELLVSLNDLVDRVQKVAFADGFSSGSNGKHSGLSTDGMQLCTGRVGAQSSNQFKSNVPIAIHSLGVDFQNMTSPFQIRKTEFNLTVQTSGTSEGRIQCIGSVGGHEYLDVTTSIETI